MRYNRKRVGRKCDRDCIRVRDELFELCDEEEEEEEDTERVCAW